jgi:predicted anti-sigma-YlaC factor YlaD
MRSHISTTCRTLIAQLSGFLDGELDAAPCEIIERHLAACHSCRVVADTMRKTIALYRGRRVAVPREVHVHLMRAVELEQLQRHKGAEG